MTARVTGDALQEAREILLLAPRVLVLTGAGISAESGVPTFRGPGGLWKEHRPEAVATPEAFRRDPRLVWEWYAWRREIILRCSPNAGHRVLAQWLLEREGTACLATQNVDGLHARAANGTGSPILELHGSLFRVRCTECRREAPHSDPVDTRTRESLPRCPACGGLLRPAVVWFGEPLPTDALDPAYRWAATADVTLVVGTSALVHPAAALPLVTRQRGGTILEVNPERSSLTSYARISLRGPAGEVLPALLGMREHRGV